MEATWTEPNGTVHGLQAKYFTSLGSSEKKQATKSVRQAVDNYPSLATFTICVPFALTGKTASKTTRPRRGQHDVFDDWVVEWEKELKAQGATVRFVLWDASELLRLFAAADTTGGLQRYWFGDAAFRADWFLSKLENARAQAGSRYSPQLDVATPLDDALQAFGRTEAWRRKAADLNARFEEELGSWRQFLKGDQEMTDDLAEDMQADASELLKTSIAVMSSLKKIIDSDAVARPEGLENLLKSALDLAQDLEPRLVADLKVKYGDRADTPGFRQYQSEFMVRFPMAGLDALRDLWRQLSAVGEQYVGITGSLPFSKSMLLSGEAGIGKTHGILDAAIRRHNDGYRSVVMFGEDVNSDGPWVALARKLGLNLTSDALLDALEAAGEASGSPLIIYIDGLNETQPDRRKWHQWLPPMITEIERKSWIRLCVSCRDTFLRDVIPTGVHLPKIEHNGFLDREYEALVSFFEFFRLGTPAEPLLQEEFSNPLFLRIVCEALRDTGLSAIPVGRTGMRGVINLLLMAKNKKGAIACGYDERQDLVGPAMLRLAAEMAVRGSRALPLAEARTIVDATPTSSASLFDVLESEALVTVVETPAVGLGVSSEFKVRFTFERIGDHLIVEHLLASREKLDDVFTTDGVLHFLAKSDEAMHENAGLVEALSVQLPETHGIEILDALPIEPHAAAMRAFLKGLHWRDSKTLTARTAQLLAAALHDGQNSSEAFEALLRIATRPDIPLNATFLSKKLRGATMIDRDPWLAHCIIESYSGFTDTVSRKSGVHRLIDTARRADLRRLPDDVAFLWCTMLAWFCAIPDRRVRDRATMALVSVLRARPHSITALLAEFLDEEDEYVVERVLVASYGALLISKEGNDAADAAELVYSRMFEGRVPPENASVRDHGRLIIELALSRVAIKPMDWLPSDFRPPYKSSWPLLLPLEQDVKHLIGDPGRFPNMNLAQKMGLATGTDFARYVVEPNVLDAFDLDKTQKQKLGVFYWFLQEAEKLGYPGYDDRCALFDRQLLAMFGPGRGKPGWAERLGKKYYWILLKRLVGRMADHIPRSVWSGDPIPPSDLLQALDLRDIDPTDIRDYLPAPENEQRIAVPAPYVFSKNGDTDDQWVKQQDLTPIDKAAHFEDRNGIVWHVIDSSDSWDLKELRKSESGRYRHITRNLQALLCATSALPKIKQAFKSGAVDLQSGPHDYRGYLGEYPRALPYTNRGPDSIQFVNRGGGYKLTNLALQQLRGREWGYDYSHANSAKTTLMPHPDLVEFGKLSWDYQGGWLDRNGVTQIQDPWWWTPDHSSGLVVRTDFLDAFLAQRKFGLVLLGLQTKSVIGDWSHSARLSERTLLVRRSGKTAVVARLVEDD
ncbi:hypothetical protein [Rhizobium leguminosarum]|uniref:hypothetical protein n=1 Tax=Rhizobium leguminosarum TaxID=384 RepID=UPI0012BC0078|nr:hypothetical protein [Rhizobium leguminosarum]